MCFDMSIYIFVQQIDRHTYYLKISINAVCCVIKVIGNCNFLREYCAKYIFQVPCLAYALNTYLHRYVRNKNTYKYIRYAHIHTLKRVNFNMRQQQQRASKSASQTESQPKLSANSAYLAQRKTYTNSIEALGYIQYITEVRNVFFFTLQQNYFLHNKPYIPLITDVFVFVFELWNFYFMNC